MKYTIEHTTCSTGNHTEISYQHADGSPLFARMAGWVSGETAIAWIERCRKNDRGRLQ